ncbi:diguanylate cyclase [Croceicoccus estronivorus]|nr:diguanylate cyclase [Croceicoccus estronivorus]
MPSELPVGALLGISNPPSGDWVRLRRLQYAHLAKVTLGRLLSHAIAGLVVLTLFLGKVPAWLLAGWAVVLAISLHYSYRMDRQLADAGHRAIGKSEFRLHMALTTGLAIVWSFPILVFTRFGSSADEMALWGVQAMLIAGAALWLSSVPLGAILFTVITGISAMVALAVDGHLAMVAVIAAFIGVAVAGTIQGARTHLTARIAEAGVAEKSEVVSLLLREFQESEADWLWQIDTSRRVRSVSPRFAYALGQDPDTAEGMPFLQLIAGDGWDHGNFPPSLHELAERLKRRESFSNLMVRVTIGKQKKWWELSGTPKINDAGKFIGFRGVGSDVTEQRESSDKIAYLARYDTLTGLPNRMMLMEALGDAMKYADQWKSRCAFLMIDLDRFKQINDSLGHQIGDRLLAQVAERLKSLVSNNELCGRLGGDEFAIVMRDASDMRRIDQVAQSVINLLSQPYDVDNHTLYVGSSVGSAIGPRDGATVETLMRNADLALYRAKDGGRGIHIQFEPSLHQDAEERRKLEMSLRHALERNEFLLNYQPVVDARRETVVSFEALLRWQSPEHGLVSPVKFIPLAEDTRMIVSIGEWVLNEACREATTWPAHVKIAVNVSGEQLLAPNFAETVVKALAATGLDPQRLEIEVTESIFLRDDVTARNTLEEIIALGCSVALDDFGTGYSSLGYLRKLRFSTIKVDRSFVQGAAKGNAESLAIIRAVVAMADSLGMSTTAEGVENAVEARLIRELGCKKIQGYHFGRPMIAADVQRIFRQTDTERHSA